MKTATLTDAEIRARNGDALVERLGASGAARFAIQAERGHGDYAERGHAMPGRLTVDELLASMKASQPRASKKRRCRPIEEGREWFVSTPRT